MVSNHGWLGAGRPQPPRLHSRVVLLAVLIGPAAGLARAEIPWPRAERPQAGVAYGPSSNDASRPAVGGLVAIPPSADFRAPEVRPIDLPTALRLAQVQNPELLLARQRVVEAAALRQLAAAQFLPSINLGMGYDTHS